MHAVRRDPLFSLESPLLTRGSRRLITGPLCDLYGPRYVMVGILFVSAIPCGLAGTITSVTGEPMLLKYTVEKSDTIPRSGLYLIRFFVGIAGAAFVPCRSSPPTLCLLPTSADPLSHCRSLVVSRIH